MYVNGRRIHRCPDVHVSVHLLLHSNEGERKNTVINNDPNVEFNKRNIRLMLEGAQPPQTKDRECRLAWRKHYVDRSLCMHGT